MEVSPGMFIAEKKTPLKKLILRSSLFAPL